MNPRVIDFWIIWRFELYIPKYRKVILKRKSYQAPIDKEHNIAQDVQIIFGDFNVSYTEVSQSIYADLDKDKALSILILRKIYKI